MRTLLEDTDGLFASSPLGIKLAVAQPVKHANKKIMNIFTVSPSK